MIDRALLARYLRQLAELGIDEIAFDGLTAEQAVALLSGSAPRGAPGGRISARELAAAAGITAGEAGGGEGEDGAGAPSGAGPHPHAHPHPHPALPGAETGKGGRALTVLGSEAAGCTRCGLHATRSTVVFGEGSATADVVVVGEAPGQEEDRTGRPFVGRAGKLLDLLLMTAGFPRESVYICNVLKCRPPNNRNPLADEVTACTTSFLHGQLEAIAPRVLLAVGKFAAQALLQSEESIGRLRGVVHAYRGTPLIVTYHPAYLLRSPQMTRVAWQDFQLLRKVLDEQARG